MEHLDNDQTKDLILLINSFLSVFQDIPSVKGSANVVADALSQVY